MQTKALTLTMITKLATLASEDYGAAADLRSYVHANAVALAPLLGAAAPLLCASVDECPDERIGASMLRTLKDAKTRLLDAKRSTVDAEATRAADRLTSSATFTDRPGVLELDTRDLRAALACREDRLRLAFGESHVDVNATVLREILSVRSDARVYVHTLDAPHCRVVAHGEAWYASIPVTVAWGERGGMRLRALRPLTAADTHGALSKRITIRTLNVPGPAFSSAPIEETIAPVAPPVAPSPVVEAAPVARETFDYVVPSVRELAPANAPEPRSNVIHVTFGLDPRRAYAAYSEASAIDENPARMGEAETLYREAIRRDPSMAVAYTNLGNIRFRKGDTVEAETLYARALEIDANQPEALYNTGYIVLERGRSRESIEWFKRAVDADPAFADAWFNMAMAYEYEGERTKARNAWHRYLDLESSGTWADIARQHLNPSGLRAVSS
jgi:hypothetical protein